MTKQQDKQFNKWYEQHEYDLHKDYEKLYEDSDFDEPYDSYVDYMYEAYGIHVNRYKEEWYDNKR